MDEKLIIKKNIQPPLDQREERRMIDIPVIRPELTDPKATMPITPRTITNVPFKESVSYGW